MNGETTHLSPSEVRRALDRLRQPDILRLSFLARIWVGGLHRRDADDLLNEAIDRILSGRRPWPVDVAMPAFFNGVMRSIANQWRREDIRESLIEDHEEGGFDEVNSVTPNYELNDLLSRMRQALCDDPQARGVLEHILADNDREEAQVALGLDATGYDTARHRMIRHMFATFNSGWIL